MLAALMAGALKFALRSLHLGNIAVVVCRYASSTAKPSICMRLFRPFQAINDTACGTSVHARRLRQKAPPVGAGSLPKWSRALIRLGHVRMSLSNQPIRLWKHTAFKRATAKAHHFCRMKNNIVLFRHLFLRVRKNANRNSSKVLQTFFLLRSSARVAEYE
jgi:hypothetical protein